MQYNLLYFYIFTQLNLLFPFDNVSEDDSWMAHFPHPWPPITNT